MCLGSVSLGDGLNGDHIGLNGDLDICLSVGSDGGLLAFVDLHGDIED